MSTVPHRGRLRVADLSPAERRWLLAQRYDWLVEKHEGPFAWRDLIEPEPIEVIDPGGARRRERAVAAEFLRFDDDEVLLPVAEEHHAQLRRLRVARGEDGASLTLFLEDTTFDQGPGAGRLAFCERAPGHDWFLCTVWHEWFPSR